MDKLAITQIGVVKHALLQTRVLPQAVCQTGIFQAHGSHVAGCHGSLLQIGVIAAGFKERTMSEIAGSQIGFTEPHFIHAALGKAAF